jgi:glycosyltransferase involved in cell wall biosynthesis
MRIALVHDYLSQDGGAEKVLEAFMDLYPDAPAYTLFFDPKKIPTFAKRDVRTSFFQRLPFARSKYQWYLPLMPVATERLDLCEFDVVISNASAFAKGVIVRPEAIHICYCHTPTRYLWSDTHSYVEELRMPSLVKALLPPVLSALRVWDRQAADRVDYFIANSRTVAQRIKTYYRRDSTVIYPPVDVHRFAVSPDPKTYFLSGGRLVSYKRFDMIVQAANMTGLPVKIFGTGPLLPALRRMAKPNITFLGKVPSDQLPALYAGAKAFIHPQVEDFGITAVESMASGRPVIAYRKGGATETVLEGITGIFLEEQSWEELADAMIRFDTSQFDPATIVQHAQQFRRERFLEEIRRFVEEKTPYANPR